jgi:filamentous hemagglutinin family protein
MAGLRTAVFVLGSGGVCCIPPQALANPQGGTVVGGQATIATTGPSTVTIDQSSKIAIIDWNSFNIGKGETTRFVQPNASSTAVNRIGGNDPTVILGELDANGRVILINGNGLLFGAGATVNVGALIATTHDASNADLMSGKANFDGAGSSTASITNNGRINATSGMVGLIAPAVANNGVIAARLGSVTLGAATQFTLDFTGDGLISFPIDADLQAPALDANGKPVTALVSNSGRIVGRTVLLTARAAQSIVENAISMGGVIRATSAQQSGGSIVLDGGDGAVSVSGKLNASDTASGATGGSIEVLGEIITLNSTAQFEASGDGGGGEILVGGDAHGAGPLPNATDTDVAAGATLTADAITKGGGGTVVVWSNDATDFAGAISAKGGATGGDGGFVETSGKQLLTVADGATVNTLAPRGTAGDWLLDPATITVQTGGTGTVTGAGSTSDTTSTYTISPATLAASSSNIILAASTSITVNNAISLSNTGVGITFEGAGSNPSAGPSLGTTLAASVTTNGGAVTIDGPTTLDGNTAINTGTGAVTFSGGVSGAYDLAISSTGTTTFKLGLSGLTGLTTGAGGTVVSGGAVSINGPTTLDGDLTINAAVGAATFSGTIDGAHNLTLNNTGTTTFGGAVGSNTALASLTTGTGATILDSNITTTNGAVTINGATTLGGNVTISAGAGGVTFNSTVDGAYNLAITNSGATTFIGAIGASTPLASLTTGTGMTTLDGNVTTTNGAVTINGPATIDVSNLVTISTGTGAVDFAGELTGDASAPLVNLTIDNTSTTTFGGTIFANHGPSSLTVNTGMTYLGGSVTISGGAVHFNSAVTLNSDATINSSGNTFSGAVDGAHNLTLVGVTTFDSTVGATTPLSSLTAGTTTLDGNVATSNGAVLFSNPVTLGSNISISTGTGAVTFAKTVAGGTHALTIINTAGLTFTGVISGITSLRFTTSGTTTFSNGLSGVTALATGPGVTTMSGAVAINGATTLGGDLTVKAGSSAVSFNGPVDGAHNLSVTTTGPQTFAGALGATTPLASLTTGVGPVTLDGDVSTTNGAVTINGVATLGGNVTLSTGTGAIGFANAVNGAYSLTIVGSGATTFGGVVGSAVTPLSSLTTGSGTTQLSGNVTTTGAQSYDGAVQLTGPLQMSAGAGDVTFASTLQSSALPVDYNSLTITTNGDAIFNGPVNLGGELLRYGSGPTNINANVTTSAQYYQGAVTLNAPALSTANSNGSIQIGGALTLDGNTTINTGTGSVTFDGAVSGAYALSIASTGTTTFNLGLSGLTGLTTGAGGTVVSGGAVSIAGPTTLDGDLTIDALVGTVTFSGTVDGAHNLTVDNAGVTFGGALGATTPLASLTTSPSTAATFDGSVTTANGAVTINGVATLGGNVTLSTGTGAIDFANAVNGAYALTIVGSGATTFGGVVGATTPLSSLTTGSGTTQLSGNVTTTGAQSYDGAVQLTGPLLMSAGVGDVTFASTLQSSAVPVDWNSLTVNTNGSVTFNGIVNLGGGFLRYGSGQTNINANITTASAQYYQDAVTLNASALSTTDSNGSIEVGGPLTLLGNVTLSTTNAAVSINSTIDTGASATAPANLSVSTGSGEQTYGGALGANNALGSVVLNSSNAAGLSLASAANNIASVNVTGGGAVTIANSGALTVTGISTIGDVLVSTQSGDLTIAGAVTTASATATALTLEAGRSNGRVASPGDVDTNGNVVIADGGSLSIGAGGFGTIYTGSITGSTGLSAVVGAGDYRYWSDTNGETGYTTTLSAGISAIYREQPVVTVTAAVPGSGQTYDGQTTSPTLSTTGQVNGDAGSGTGDISVTSGGAPSTLLNAGSYTVSVTNVSAGAVLGGLGYAAQAGTSTTYVISPAVLTAALTGTVTKTYDATTAASLTAGNYTLSGTVYGSDVVALNDPVSGTYADANAGTGKTVTVTGLLLNNPNYVLTSATASAPVGEIDPAVLTAALTGTVTKTYDATTSANLTAGNYTLSGMVYGSDVVALNDPANGAFADANAGTGKTVTVTGLALSNPNYMLASTTTSAAIGEIDPAVLTAALTGAVTKTYDATTSASLTAGNYTLSGTIYGSDVVTLNDPASGAYADANAGTGKTVTVTGLALNNPNYVLASNTASAAIGEIDPAVLTAALTGIVTKTYDGTTAASLTVGNYTLSGTVYGSDVVALNDPASGAYADANAGTGKTVTVTGLALNNPNYVLALSSASAAIGEIDPAVLTAALTGTVTKTYDGTTAAGLTVGNYTLSGTIYGSDVVTLNDPVSGTYADANAGTGKTVTVTGLALSNPDYVLTSTTASAAIGEIDPAALTAALTGTVTKTYDGTTAASLTIGNYTLSGTIYGSDVVTLNDPSNGAYADANVGTGKTVTVTGLTLSNPNYVLASSSASAAIGVIDPAVLTAGLTGAVMKAYDGTTAASLTPVNYKLSGTIFGSDQVALNDPATGAFDNASVGTGKTVIVTGLALNNANYVLASTTVSATIGSITQASSTGTTPPAPPPATSTSTTTIGLTSTTTPVYDLAITTDFTIPVDTFSVQTIMWPTNLIDLLYHDCANLSGTSPSANDPSCIAN